MTQSAAFFHARRALRRLVHEPLLRLGLLGPAQILGQISNLGVQALLLHELSPLDYGRIGIAGIVVTSAIFLLDLGYGQHFLRRPVSDPDWMRDWSASLTQRCVAACVTAAVLLLVWFINRNDDSVGWFYLLGASPALVGGSLNLPLVAIARGRAGLAGAAIVMQAVGIFLGSFFVLHFAPPGISASFALGVVSSLGVVIQLAVCCLGLRDFTLLRPATIGWLRLDLLRGSAAIWMLALVGTLYERSVLFFVEVTDSALLPALVLVVQVLGGLLSVMSQFQKLVLPVLAGGAWDDNSTLRNRALLSVGLLVGGVAFVTLAAGFMLAILAEARSFLDHRLAIAIYAISWAPQCLMVGLGSLWFSKRKELRFLQVLGGSALVASLISYASLHMGSALPTLMAKAGVTCWIWAATLVMFDVRRHIYASSAIAVSIFVSWALSNGISPAAAALCYIAASLICFAAAVSILVNRPARDVTR